MRSALGLLGVLDARAEPVFDGLAALAATSAGVPMAEIVYLVRRGWVRKAQAGGVPPEVTDDPDDGEGAPHLVGRSPIVLLPFGGTEVPVGEVRVYDRAPRSLTTDEQVVLDQVARQVAVELELRWMPAGAGDTTQLVGVAVVDADSLLLAATPEMEAMYGYTVETHLGRSMVEMMHPDDLDGAIEAFTRTSMFDGTKVPFDIRVRAADETWVPTEFTADNRLTDPDIEGIVFVVRDQRARSRPDALVGGEARVLESVARGAPLPITLRMLATLVESQDPDAWCVIMLADDEGATLRPVAWGRMPDDVLAALSEVPVGPASASCGTAAHRMQSVLSDDLRTDPAWDGWREPLLDNGFAACWSHPVADFDHRRTLGTVAVYRLQAGQPTNEHARLLDLCAQLVSTAVEHARSQERLTYQATHDPLTGLPNRRLFLEALGRSVDVAREGGFAPTIAVLFVDLDQFKLINDSLGHQVGDHLLRQVADRLAGEISPADTIARFGGDEFTLLLHDVITAADVEAVGERLLAEVSRPYEVDGRELVVSASIGVAIAGPGQYDPNGLVSDADAAMYRAKERGRLRIEVFDERMRTASTARLATEQGLRRAIAGGELRLVFQPEVLVAGGQPTGAEALVRWAHPARGTVMPVEFIPVAEETGLIMPLGEWVLFEAFTAAKRLADGAASSARHRTGTATSAAANGPGGPPHIVWANVSARQLSGSDLVSVVERALESTGADPTTVGLEVTESALMVDAEVAVDVLRRLKDLGVHLAIDDFGTGYSSLSYLKRLPFDVVKIDQSFIAGLGTDPEDSAIVAAVIGLTHTLGLRSLAEGVETEAQRVALVDLGCELAQGYLFAVPVPESELTDLLAGPLLPG
jgi:diguanylate cyclase (GGDEF)-like protein/PAS domain S-box-containing protein